MTDPTKSSEPTFTRKSSALAMTCGVRLRIQAGTRIVWSLLTDASAFPRWNSTVTGIEGDIRDGERLRLHVPGTTRTFTPKVSVVVPGLHMTWGDGIAGVFQGVRTFLLRPLDDGSTEFLMEERFAGVMFALIKGMLPDFRPIFETFASDLKREAERVASQPPRASPGT